MPGNTLHTNPSKSRSAQGEVFTHLPADGAGKASENNMSMMLVETSSRTLACTSAGGCGHVDHKMFRNTAVHMLEESETRSHKPRIITNSNIKFAGPAALGVLDPVAEVVVNCC